MIELRSSSNSLEEVRAKMCEYQENGLKLGWLIDPTTATVEVYREQRSPELLLQPDMLSGELILPGFKLDLRGILTL